MRNLTGTARDCCHIRVGRIGDDFRSQNTSGRVRAKHGRQKCREWWSRCRSMSEVRKGLQEKKEKWKFKCHAYLSVAQAYQVRYIKVK